MLQELQKQAEIVTVASIWTVKPMTAAKLWSPTSCVC